MDTSNWYEVIFSPNKYTKIGDFAFLASFSGKMVHQIESNIPSMIKSYQFKKLFRIKPLKNVINIFTMTMIQWNPLIACIWTAETPSLMLCFLRLRPHSHWMRLVNALFLQLFCTLWQQTPPLNELNRFSFSLSTHCFDVMLVRISFGT